MNDMIFLGGVTLKEITEARLITLGHAIDLAAKRGTKKPFDDIDANISYTEALLDKKNDLISLAAIMDFYGLLGAASHNNVRAQSKNVLWYVPAGATIGSTIAGTMLADIVHQWRNWVRQSRQALASGFHTRLRALDHYAL